MNTIDERILIPTTPSVVWDYISDLKNNPGWQSDCRAVAFLTSKQSGQGTRYRATTEKGREQVIEITAWYEGLGYQYTYIDGMPFKESTGRIRLQEIPEGTVVQWTITYEMSGVLGGVRGSLGMGRQIESMMVASLKALWKQVNSSGAAQKVREAKSLMRDAPDYEARAQYKPRHPSIIDSNKPEETPAPAPQPTPVLTTAPATAHVIPEPPISDEDTRPRVPVAAAPPAPDPTATQETAQETAEPDFLTDHARFAPPPDFGSDTQPITTIPEHAIQMSPVIESPIAPEPAAEVSYDFAFDDEPAAPAADEPQTAASSADLDFTFDDAPAATTLEPPALETAAAAVEWSVDDILAAPTAPEADTPPGEPTQEETHPVKDEPLRAALSDTTRTLPRVPLIEEIDASAMDTAQISIWEVFGMPRPSETRELPKFVEAETLAAPADDIAEPEADAAPDVQGIVSVDISPELLLPRRTGLRVQLRRRSVRLRRVL